LAEREFYEKVNRHYILILLSIYAILSIGYGAVSYYNFLAALYGNQPTHVPVIGLPNLPPTSLLLDNIDITFTFGPLVMIAISFDALNHEKVTKSLGLLASYPISRATIIKGKFLGLSLLFLPVAVVLPSTAILASLALAGQLQIQMVLKAAGLGFLIAIYLLFWLSLAVLISALTESPGDSLAACMGIWLVLLPGVFGLVVALMLWTVLWPGKSYSYLINVPGYFALNNLVGNSIPPYRFIHALYDSYYPVGLNSSPEPVPGASFILNTNLTFMSWLTGAFTDVLVLAATILAISGLTFYIFNRADID
jgi:ABC-2 type transport system permease protein